MIRDGKVVKTFMRSLRIDEVSAVDRPAQAGALAAILKRDSQVEKIDVDMALTTMTGGHTHLITMGGGDYKRRAGNTDYTDGHSHPWLMDEAGNITVGHAQGHNHGIEIVAKGEMSESSLKERLSKEGPSAASSDANTPADNPPADPLGNPGETMTPEEKAAQDAAAKRSQDTITALEKRAQRAESIASLSDSQRTYFKALNGAAAQDAFLALDDNGRDGEIRKAAEANQVVYTAEDGSVYRKNDDPRLVSMAKCVDAEKKRYKDLEAKAAKSALEKRVSEFPHLPGTPEEVTNLVKAIEALPESERESAYKALKAQNDRLGKSFERLGTSNKQGADSDSLDPIDKLATEIAKREGITFEKAYAKALETPEGQKAYEQHVNKRHGAAV